MQMLGRREGGGAPRDEGTPRGGGESKGGGDAKPAQKKPAGKFDDMEDDIPF
jgi:single-stranded DNA-binding protein